MKRLKKMNFNELKQNMDYDNYILLFSASWCSDCNFIKPFIPSIEKEYPNYNFILVDRDENMDLASEMNVFGIPSFIAFKNKTEIGRLVNKNRKTKKQIEDFMNSLNK